MPDITMCTDGECPKKRSCYRYEAEADEYWQSFFSESPRVGDNCEYYWLMNKQQENQDETNK